MVSGESEDESGGAANSVCEKPHNLCLFINILDFTSQEAKSIILCIDRTRVERNLYKIFMDGVLKIIMEFNFFFFLPYIFTNKKNGIFRVDNTLLN